MFAGRRLARIYVMRSPLFRFLLVALLLTACTKNAALPKTGSGASSQNSSVMTKEMLEAVASTGNADAEFSLGQMYLEGTQETKDVKKGLELLKKAAEHGSAMAQFNLGVMYHDAVDVPVDFAEARKWFEKAADQNIDRAEYNLGVMYYRGEGVKVDYVKALSLFTASAKSGFSDAAYNLGVMYAKGQGTKQSGMDAFAWFSIAAAEGDAKAPDVIANLKTSMTPQQIDQANSRMVELMKMITLPNGEKAPEMEKTKITP